MEHRKLQPETLILEKPTVVGFVDLNKFEKRKKVAKVPVVVQSKPAKNQNQSSGRNTIGSIIREHFGFIYVDKKGNLKSTKK